MVAPEGWVVRNLPDGGVRIASIPARIMITGVELEDMATSGRFGKITFQQVLNGPNEGQRRVQVEATNGVWIYRADVEGTGAADVWRLALVEQRPVRVPAKGPKR